MAQASCSGRVLDCIGGTISSTLTAPAVKALTPRISPSGTPLFFH